MNPSGFYVDPKKMMRKIFLIFNTIYLQCFNVLQLQKKARLLNQLVKESRLRKLGDSNPRYGYPYGSLASCWFQPLTQTSNLLWERIFSQMRCKYRATF